jgi:hypothetical protein
MTCLINEHICPLHCSLRSISKLFVWPAYYLSWRPLHHAFAIRVINLKFQCTQTRAEIPHVKVHYTAKPYKAFVEIYNYGRNKPTSKSEQDEKQWHSNPIGFHVKMFVCLVT